MSEDYAHPWALAAMLLYLMIGSCFSVLVIFDCVRKSWRGQHADEHEAIIVFATAPFFWLPVLVCMLIDHLKHREDVP